MMNISPYQFKNVPGKNVQYFNALFRRDLGRMVEVGEDNYELRFEPEGGASPLTAPMEAHIQINDRIGFKFCPQEQLLYSVVADVMMDHDLKTLSEELRGIVLETAFERILDHIDQHGDHRATIQRLCDHSTSGGSLQIHFSATRLTDGACFRGYLLTDEAGLQWLATTIDCFTSHTCRDLDLLSAPGDIDIGGCRLSAREVNRLEPNDIVLVDGTGELREREIRIRLSNSIALEGNLVAPNRLLIQNIITNNGERMKMEQSNPLTNTADLPVDDIPIDLVFEIGRTQMPIGTLKHLQPGYTVALSSSIDQHKPVTLIANGTTVGRGEIVLIDNHLGIRILEINAQAGSL